MNDNLPELRDIHLPDGVSAWPPAYGWWVILAGILGILLAAWLFSFLRKKSKKLYALHLLRNIHCNNTLDSAVQMSIILRRICVFKYPAAATLFGREWIEFLNSKCKSKLSGKTAELLMNAPYIAEKGAPFSSADVIRLRQFCQAWIGENL
ncbi:MAG: DUF4381 domain-containing protein [Proteobacteria bacterium]|nr:DUF4381 domain-containing protein [Pseudomonadota bacterium]